jgi:superfamily II DNA or RNA helicase
LPASRLGDVFQPRTGDLTEAEAIEQLSRRRARPRNGSQHPLPSSPFAPAPLFEHQIAVLEAWERSNNRGLVSFVTGGGKTKVGLAATRKWLSMRQPVLILVPGEVLVEQWCEEMQIELDPQKYDFVQVGAGVAPTVWRPLVHRAFEALPENKPSVILATYDSARSESFLRLFERLRPRLLVVADEVHAIASGQTRAIMSRIDAESRLGLSATPQRHGDPEGTQLIFDYFGEILEPRFLIADAIRAGRLVPYSYQIHECHLNNDENAEYERLTALIRILASQENVDPEALNAKRRERANIVKSAEDKAALASNIIAETGSRYSRWLIYCNSVKQAEDVGENLRGIGITPLTYNSYMNVAKRRATLKHFEAEGGHLLAVHCLDQGVDIPCLDAALILASSTNPREFIQRRGRILRKSQGKFKAEIFDVVTLTARGSVALRSEIERSTEIAESAQNRDTIMIEINRLLRLTEGTDESVEDEEYM